MSDALVKAREAAAERAKVRQAAAEARELEELELEAKYEAELGPRGSAFEIVRTVDGPIVVKLNDVTFFKKFAASDKQEAAIYAFVEKAIAHPPLEKFKTIIDRRGELLGVVGMALRTLHVGAEEVERGK